MAEKRMDVVLDTDAYNEIDDQFAIAYLCRLRECLNPAAFYAAPFFNAKSNGPCEGMKKSYQEIFKILTLCGRDDLKEKVFYGSETYLPDEKTPVESDAMKDLVKRAKNYSPENPLYVVAIGAITNIASAFLAAPEIAKNIVLIWLGGHARHWRDTLEFNMKQDIAAARVVMASGAKFVQLPCRGVVSEFRVSAPELRYWLAGKNELADYLARNTIEEAESYAAGKPWTRVIWDVTAIAWLVNENERFMKTRTVPVRLPGYDGKYEANELDKTMCYVEAIERDALMDDLFRKITA